MRIVEELVNLDLTSIDGNAFSLMAAFKRAAKEQRTPKEEIDKVIQLCQTGDYDNLVAVLSDNTEYDYDSDNFEDDDEF